MEYLEEKGEIYLSKYSGWYSVSDEAFYQDDEIEEKMVQNTLNHQVLLVEWLEEESYFFKLSKWQINYLSFMKIILTLFYQNQEKMKL